MRVCVRRVWIPLVGVHGNMRACDIICSGATAVHAVWDCCYRCAIRRESDRKAQFPAPQSKLTYGVMVPSSMHSAGLLMCRYIHIQVLLWQEEARSGFRANLRHLAARGTTVPVLRCCGSGLLDLAHPRAALRQGSGVGVQEPPPPVFNPVQPPPPAPPREPVPPMSDWIEHTDHGSGRQVPPNPPECPGASRIASHSSSPASSH